MIFGKTHVQKQKEKIDHLISQCFVKTKFAYLPTELTDGRFVWLQDYYFLEPILIAEGNEPYYSSLYCLKEPRYATEEEAKDSPLYKKWKIAGWAS